MIERKAIIQDYERVLLGQRKTFSCGKVALESERKEIVGIIWGYAITNLLKWTPEDAMAYINPDIVRALKLDTALKIINVPYTGKQDFDYEYVLSLSFPDKIKYDAKAHCINEYEKILKIGKYSSSKEVHQFSKKFFDDAEGLSRAAIVLNYAVSRYLGLKTMAELYEFFNDEKQAMRFLRKYKIADNARLIYSNPLDYFHNSMGEKRDNFLYYNQLFKNAYEKTKAETEKISQE